MGVRAMSKKFQKDGKSRANRDSARNNGEIVKIDEKSALEATVGCENVERWTKLKEASGCKSNANFATKLLNLAQQYLKRNGCKEQDSDTTPKRDDKDSSIKLQKRKTKNDSSNISEKQSEPANKEPFEAKAADLKINNELKLEIKKEHITNSITDSPLDVDKDADKTKKNKKHLTISQPNQQKKDKDFNKKKVEHDIRKAPDLDVQIDNKLDTIKNEAIDIDKVANIKIKLCQNCNTRHIQDHCPLNYPNFMISDSITHQDWIEKYKNLHDNHLEAIKSDKENEQKSDDSNKYAYATVSLPDFLEFVDTNSDHGLAVKTNIDIEEFTQFGPLVGKIVKEVDISEDSNMRDLWEIQIENGNIYINTEDWESSNWMRFVRPAPVRDEKNVTVVTKENCLYFISTKFIKSGEEFLYWQDSVVANNKKKMEKTSCGGCNMTFAHPLYYRTHCSVFHDVRYSLTIRKYHCKVCGAAVLGKENIMKHAAELHNGQGAYQCQFCKKFFLRLNYLEMHRTYGCSANPHRSRPLCDFCGRKFCQPQKLKVHIKRMHSDFAEVLKEFQCKSCLKILGSRAALQRHLKEVHQKQIDGACSCSRCGKHFQNKSNLKIHMLTHSGIKPFKCVVKSCNAAFTTKQCLQFHYKKVHNYGEEAMPKIERSIDYTFEAYSGLEEQEDRRDDVISSQQNDSTAATLDEESELDENSMDSKNLDDPLAIESPLQVSDNRDNNTPEPSQSPPSSQQIDTYLPPTNNTLKVLSKGSKKWIGDQPDLYQIEPRLSKPDADLETYERSNKIGLNDFNRHEASNASLLVEAALDSVCSEPNIDIDVSTTPSCTDALVNNLYTLAPQNTLNDVTYSESVCMTESRDINLISPSVNEQISVTDDLSDNIRHHQSITMDYSGFHQEDFSPGNSPEMHHRSNFVRNYINNLSPQHSSQVYGKNASPPVNVSVSSPPRYDFGHAATTVNDHLSSDDSNGMAAQNLSLHSKHDIQLDLSIYKSPYKLEHSFQARKDFRLKFDADNNSKNYDDDQLDQDQNDISNNIVEIKDKETEDSERGIKYQDEISTDLRTKFDIDLDLRSRSIYENTSDLEFRNKNYESIDKQYEGTLESDFRTPDRNFEPLVLNSSELQGLDMSARSFHNYPNINRYHPLYPDVDRVDLRLNYSPPAPPYSHADILRVVSLDLTPPGRHSVDLSLRSHPLHQIANSRLLTEHGIQVQATQHRLLDQTRLLSSDLSGRILSDHTTNRILANNDQLSANHLLPEDQPRLIEQSRLISDGRILQPATPSSAVSPVPPFPGYTTVSQSPYHPTALAPPRPHVTSPTPTPYHHYSGYY